MIVIVIKIRTGWMGIMTMIENGMEISTVIGNRMEMEITMEIMIEIVGVLVITGNHLIYNVVAIPIRTTPSSYHQAFSDEAVS